MTTQPKYRADVKGNLRAICADFRTMCSTMIASADYFVMDVTDLTEAYDEYSKYLTHDEMVREFKRALKST